MSTPEFDEVVATRGDDHVEARLVDLGIEPGAETNLYSPMGEVHVARQIFSSSALHRPGWRRNVMLGLIFGLPAAAILAARISALSG